MKKTILFAAAFAGVLCSCSQDDVETSGSLDSAGLEPIKIGVSSHGSVATRGTGTVGGVEGDNDWAGQSFRLYMFNKGTVVPATESDGHTAIYENYDFRAPGSGESGVATAFDQSVKYYPTSGSFDFVAYRIDDATGTPAVPTAVGSDPANPDSIVIGVKIDGTQDIMSAVAVPSDEELALLSSYPDRYYSSYSAHRGVNPNLLFRHLLTRLNFQIIGGNEASCVKAGEAAGQETCVRVTKIEVLSKSAGSLTIAKAGGDMTSAGSLQFDSEVDTLVLMQRPEGASDNVDLEPMDVVMPTWNSISNSGNEVQAGDAMLVAPDRSYEVKITLRQRVQTGVDGSDRPVMEDKELIVKDVISLPSSSSAAGFLAGNSYNVKIVVYGLEKVNVNATLTPWTEGEDIYLDPIDGAASLAAQGE